MRQVTLQRGFCACIIAVALVVSPLSHGTQNAGALAPKAGECIDLVQNGGFESGAAGWQEYSSQGSSLISDFNPRSGQLGAYLGGLNNAQDKISQQVTLPTGWSAITLRAWWQLTTSETAGTFDTMTISLLDVSGTPLAHLAQVDNTFQAGIWDELAIDLRSYAGRTVTLQFAVLTDDSNVSAFYVDDVSILACGELGLRTYLPLVIRG